MSTIGYVPVNVGYVLASGNFDFNGVRVFGFARDSSSALVAISVQGPKTNIERLWALIYGSPTKNVRIAIRPDFDGAYGNLDAWVNQGASFLPAIKSNIPDTSDDAMIIMSEGFSVEADPRDRAFFYEPYTTREDLELRMIDRVKKTVSVYVNPAWRKKLYDIAMLTKAPGALAALVHRIPNASGDKYRWGAIGFDVLQISTDANAWTKLIVDSLKSGQIKLEDSDDPNKTAN